MFKSQNNAFVRSNKTGGSSGGFKRARPADHLIEILAYDLENHVIKGRNHLGNEAYYKIGMDAYTRCERSSANYKGGAKWLGHRIDDKMAAHLKVGRRVVIEQAVFTHKKDGLSCYEGNQVINSTSQAPHKLFTGLFTASKYENRVNRVQHWADQAFQLSDKEKLAEFVKKMEENRKSQEAGELTPYWGFMVRAMRKEGDKWLCFDSTTAFESTPAPADENGKSKYLQINKDDMLALLKEYREYLTKSYAEMDMKWTVDILTFRSYKASSMSTDMEIKKNSFSYMMLVDAMGKTSADDAEGFVGMNAAVAGIVEITKDEIIVDEVDETKTTVKKRDLVQKLHANNWISDIRRRVKAFDGTEVELMAGLEAKKPMDDKAKYNEETKSLTHALGLMKTDYDKNRATVHLEPVDEDPWGEENPFGDN